MHDEDLTLPADLGELVDVLPQLAAGQPPAPYALVSEVEDDREGQDDLEGLGGPGEAPRTSREAVALGREWVREDVFVGIGYCLKTVRTLFGVGPLFPDAETAWEEAEHRTRATDVDDTPWGVPEFWTNGRYGHITISLGIHQGRRLSLTTDYVRNGFLGVAPTADLGPWCGGRYVGWTRDVNGVEVWNPKRKPEPWGVEQRRALVQAALERAIRNGARDRRINGLRRWRNQLDDRIQRKG